MKESRASDDRENTFGGYAARTDTYTLAPR